MAIVTKPLVIEAKSFSEAEEKFKSIDTNVLLNNADSLGIVRYGDIVRVPDSVDTTVNVTIEEKKDTTEELLKALSKNNEVFDSLMKRLGAKTE